MANNAILIGLLAGLAAGLMVAAGLTAASAGAAGAAVLLILVSPAPVYIASLGWGTSAGIAAAAGGTVVATFAGGARRPFSPSRCCLRQPPGPAIWPISASRARMAVR